MKTDDVVEGLKNRINNLKKFNKWSGMVYE